MSCGIAGRTTSEDMELAVAALENLQDDMRHFLKAAFERRGDSADPEDRTYVDSNPKEPENWPHITNTNQIINLKDTVIASEKESSPQILITSPRRIAAKSRRLPPNNPTVGPNATYAVKLTPTELTKLAPRLTPYLRNTSPNWPEMVEAADWLREEMEISQFVWGNACLALGREQAAIAVAIVSARPSTHFRHSAGAYFHGMVSRAKAGELNLSRTIWALRNQQHRSTISPTGFLQTTVCRRSQ